jgi:hypothetical protein
LRNKFGDPDTRYPPFHKPHGRLRLSIQRLCRRALTCSGIII